MATLLNGVHKVLTQLRSACDDSEPINDYGQGKQDAYEKVITELLKLVAENKLRE